MRVSILGFGSVWRRRSGKDSGDPKRSARAAYYNTTGVAVGGKLRTRPRIVGHVRFNGVGGFNPNCPARMVGLPGWSSDDVWVIALSEWREEQEALLLMAAHGWVRTSVGKYSLKPVACEPRRPRLELTLAEEI